MTSWWSEVRWVWLRTLEVLLPVRQCCRLNLGNALRTLGVLLPVRQCCRLHLGNALRTLEVLLPVRQCCRLHLGNVFEQRGEITLIKLFVSCVFICNVLWDLNVDLTEELKSKLKNDCRKMNYYFSVKKMNTI